MTLKKFDYEMLLGRVLEDKDALENEMSDLTGLIKSLVSAYHKVESLQLASFQFLKDDKKMAEHFRLKIPVTQGLHSQMLNEGIHDFVEENPIDGKAAGRALIKIAEGLEDE